MPSSMSLSSTECSCSRKHLAPARKNLARLNSNPCGPANIQGSKPLPSIERSHSQVYSPAVTQDLDQRHSVRDTLRKRTQALIYDSLERCRQLGFIVNESDYWPTRDAHKLSLYTWDPGHSFNQPTRFLWWSELPQEIQDITLGYAFAMPRTILPSRITFTSMSSLKNLAPASYAALPFPNRFHPDAVLLKIPTSLIQLFVSKKFLRDALPHFARSTFISFEGCTLENVTNHLPRPSKTLFQYLLNGLLCSTSGLRFTLPDRPFSLNPNPPVFHFRNLQYVDLHLPSLPPTWIHRPTYPSSTGGALVQEDEIQTRSTRVQMTKSDVLNLVNHLRWPTAREQQFRAYLRKQAAYNYAKRLADALAGDGYTGRVVLRASFRCEQSDWDGQIGEGWERRHGDGEYFVLVNLQFDLCKGDELLRVDAVPSYWNPVTWELKEGEM